MSNLRLFGIIVGVLGLFLSFILTRGQKWNKGNFFFLFSFSFSILAVSLRPDIVSTLADILALKVSQRGRILALLIISIIALWILLPYYRSRIEKLNRQFDLLIRKLGDRDKQIAFRSQIKPIMVLIPAFNEAKNLSILLPKMPRKIAGKEVGVLVVDDGSSDDTAQVVKREGYAVVQNIINRGQGAASRLGYDVLQQENVEIIVTMDADNQHLPEDIEKLVQPILSNRFDLVIGSRILGGQEKSSYGRSFGIYIFNSIINFISGLKLTDCSSGFKAFNARELKKINLIEDQFQSSEVIIESAKKGLRIGEVPITITQRKYGQSKKGTNFTYGANFLRVIIKTWWR